MLELTKYLGLGGFGWHLHAPPWEVLEEWWPSCRFSPTLQHHSASSLDYIPSCFQSGPLQLHPFSFQRSPYRTHLKLSPWPRPSMVPISRGYIPHFLKCDSQVPWRSASLLFLLPQRSQAAWTFRCLNLLPDLPYVILSSCDTFHLCLQNLSQEFSPDSSSLGSMSPL